MAYKILIAEDSRTQATCLQMLLESNGYTVSLAPDGEAAIDEVFEFWPDLVISDVVMPKINGFQLCRYIKDNERTKHIRVVLLTALDSAQDLIRGLEAQADNFIRKPYDDKYLLSRIERILNNGDAEDDSTSISLSLGEQHLVLDKSQVHTSQVIELLLSMVEDTNRRLDGVLADKEQSEARKVAAQAPHADEYPATSAQNNLHAPDDGSVLPQQQIVKLYKGLNQIVSLAHSIINRDVDCVEAVSISEEADTCLCILDSEWDRVSQQ